MDNDPGTPRNLPGAGLMQLLDQARQDLQHLGQETGAALLRRMDLLTREEFALHKAALEQLQQRVANLEATLANLEQQLTKDTSR